MNEKIKISARSIISMSTEYLMEKYDEELYVDMLAVFAKSMKDELCNKKKNPTSQNS